MNWFHFPDLQPKSSEWKMETYFHEYHPNQKYANLRNIESSNVLILEKLVNIHYY